MFDVEEKSMLQIGKLFISSAFHYLTDGKVKPDQVQVQR
jgi:hypothetical protein